ncbi:5,10-methylene tetrahydromethanopterin reductase [Xaviernesmea oryzae]|uniref:5,10-methylene tetrahydromethanopterin reductase n=1 Tax=Xaviernesmea oryzae TaxID=464029 RepID=A0A1Q9B1Z7_9HYPH|nr:LLM class flavin-dependent oxidoreductase [Xaviernesmea oryzae]OLP62026.1 5,10-methylene tetrahydromethanopterin reductase [Xaviernesmea oryzae]SEK96483.1 FMN-dependent oxidoreductase, nitrilotriacetate monooxygenase family [Xaviernesmea oryzae]
MTKQIRFNAFEMNCVGHQSPGLWAHPKDQSWRYKDVRYWSELAQTLERGIFDSIFIADVIGYYDVYQGGMEHAFRQAAQIPVNDPLQLAVPITFNTKHIGVGITASTSFEHPYTFARRLATADHLTDGRVAWNIVTSYLQSGAQNVGETGLRQHDDRYAVAEEYVEVLYKLLEGSWEKGAVLRDKARRIFVDPDKVHAIAHSGRYYQVPGYHLSEPSPQRTPLLFQAGQSEAGRRFAARNAECVFVGALTKPALKAYVDDIRARAAAHGRDPAKLLVYTLLTVIVDETDEKAQAKFEELSSYGSYDGALVLMSGWSGVDLGRYKPGDAVRAVAGAELRSLIDRFEESGRSWTIEELARWGAIGGSGPVIVGSAQTVADILEDWVDETGVDGFNLCYAIEPGTFEDVVDLLVPELQRRGRYPTAYREGTLREKLFGQGPYLPETHPAARYRDIEAVKRQEREGSPA